MRPIKRKELIRRFRHLGFDGPFSGARHHFMTRGSLKVHIPNPHRQDISVDLQRKILREADILPTAWGRVRR
jgi:hypothetical protein